jgi:hypothetical protein
MNIRKLPTKLKSGPYSKDEVLAPSDRPAHPSSWAASFSLQQTTLKQEVRFDKVVTKLLGLPGPIKLHMRTVQIKACPSGSNDVDLNRHRWGLPPWNLRISTARSPPFPSECYTFPHLPRPVTTTT